MSYRDKDLDTSDIDELSEIFSKTNINTKKMTEEYTTNKENIPSVEFTFDEQEMLDAINFDMKRPVKTTSKKTRAKKSATLDVTPTILDYLKNNTEVPSLIDWNSKSSFDIKTYEKKNAPVKRENPSTSVENIIKNEATPTPKKKTRVSALPPLEDIPITPVKKQVLDNDKENNVTTITPRRSTRNRTPLSTIKQPKSIIPEEYLDRDVDADKIVEGLYVGDYKAGCNKEWLAANNIKYILNLTVSHNKKFEKEAAKTFVYKRVTIEDSPHDVDLPKMMRELVPFIEKGISEGGILIHCKLGVSRSGSVAVGYLIHKGHSLEDSLQMAKKARPVIKPLEGFVEQLKQFEMSNKISE